MVPPPDDDLGSDSDLEGEPSPSTLFVFWPWEECPLEEEVRLLLADVAKAEDSEDVGGGDDEIHWARTYRIEGHPVPILTWVCRRDEVASSWGFERARWAEGEQDRAERARWLIGVETLLDPTDPLDSFHRQLRFCAALGAEVPAVYDACSYRTWPGSELQRLTSTQVPPRTDRLFAIHAVTADEGKREQGCWLHTHGLSRAGCPEIDLMGVPVELCDAASTLINGVGDLLIGAPLPDPETPFEVGSGRTVACRPWPDAIRDMAPDALGGLQDREGDDNSHGGYRIVLVEAPDDRAPGAPRWQPPLDVVRHIDQQDGILFVSRRETERMAMLARERWAEFAMLFARHREDGWQFLVKLGYAIDGGEDDEREHLWFEVLEIAPDRVRARLLNRPLRIARLEEGQEDWHPVDRLTDWNMCTPMGTFTPENVEYLWDAARPPGSDPGDS